MIKDSISVSVVIPCYNSEAHLAHAIESLREQTRVPNEIIVVDDGSTDSSAEIAESFGDKVKVIKQENHGESVARNRGVNEASSSHIVFLDADDFFHPESLERLVAPLTGNDNEVSCMHCVWFEDDPDKPYLISEPKNSFFPHVVSANINPIHCWAVPRKMFLGLGGFQEGQHYFEDWDFWFRVGLHGATLCPVPFAGAYYRQHAKQQLKTVSKKDRIKGHVDLQERFTEGILAKGEDLIEEFPTEMFWSPWTAYHKGRKVGLSKRELSQLGKNIEAIAGILINKGKASGFVRLANLIGIHKADVLRGLFVRV